MLYVNIPTTELNVSSLCLGSGLFGSTIDMGKSFAMLDAFVERGGNFLDTAKIYADWLPGEKSSSEKAIGLWLRERRNRVSIVIGTKGGHPDLATMHIPRLSRDEITADLDASLRNLRTDWIDIYWLHRDDPNRPVEDMLDTLISHVNAGKIRYFGCSNWKLDRIKEAQEYAARIGVQGFVGNQPMWSLAAVDAAALPDPTLAVMDAPTHKYHRSTSLAAIAYSSQAQGWFQRMAQGTEKSMSEGQRKMYSTDVNRERFQRALELSRETGLSLTAIVLSYVMSQPFPAVPIVGCKNMEQLQDSLAAADVRLSGEQVEGLEK